MLLFVWLLMSLVADRSDYMSDATHVRACACHLQYSSLSCRVDASEGQVSAQASRREVRCFCSRLVRGGVSAAARPAVRVREGTYRDIS